jgi:hypothetical protein
MGGSIASFSSVKVHWVGWLRGDPWVKNPFLENHNAWL